MFPFLWVPELFKVHTKFYNNLSIYSKVIKEGEGMNEKDTEKIRK
jgi:hypothetical protein